MQFPMLLISKDLCDAVFSLQSTFPVPDLWSGAGLVDSHSESALEMVLF